MSSITIIPAFYRIFFLYIDPLVCLSSIYLFFFNQPSYLSSGVPQSLIQTTYGNSPDVTSLTRFLLRCLGAYSLFVFIMQIGLLHTFQDAPGRLNVKIWSIVQFGIFMVDGALFAMWIAEGGIGAWGSGEWANAGILIALMGVRGAFCVGVGLD